MRNQEKLKDAVFCVYMHVAPNGKRYVGVTSQFPKTRWGNGKNYWKNKYFYRAIMKYGWEAFEHIILHEGCTQEEAESYEIELIRSMDLQNPEKGYNLCSGGSVNRGFHHTEENKKLFSSARKGKAWSEEYKTNMREACKHHSPTREAIDKSREVCSRAVRAYDGRGKMLGDYLSLVEAAKALDGVVDSSLITKVCNLEMTQAYGYMFRYLEDAPENLKCTVLRNKIVEQLTREGAVIAEHKNAKTAALTIGISDGTMIGACCKGRRKSAYGFLWRYASYD